MQHMLGYGIRPSRHTVWTLVLLGLVNIILSSLHQWMESRLPASNSCPVCKSGIDDSKVIPIYVRGREAKDPRFIGLM